MSLRVPYTDSIGTGTRFTLTSGSGDSGDDLFILSGIHVESTNGDAVVGVGFEHEVWVDGTVRGFGSGIELGDGVNDLNNWVVVSATGAVSGGVVGVGIVGDGARLDNDGAVFSGLYAVVFNLPTATASAVINNSGRIVGEVAGIALSVSAGGRLEINNSGLIKGDTVAYSPFSMVNPVRETIVNTGRMEGEVFTYAGDDLIDNARGMIFGSIMLGEGNDTLAPGDDIEIASGGAGRDLLDFSAARGGRATINGSSTMTGARPGDLFTGFEDLRGSATGSDTLTGDSGDNQIEGLGGNDYLLGNNGNDTLIGGAGNDRLDGGLGGDRLEGGAGDDLYIVDNAADVVVEAANGGRDTVRTIRSLTLTAQVENGQVSGTAGLALTGNGLANQLQGGAGGDTLAGLAGADRLIGGAGNDSLDGGTENDWLTGDAGNDTLIGGAGNDRLQGGTGADRLSGGSGADSLAGNAGVDRLGGGFGADRLLGGADADVLVGGAGADTLIGGRGADRLTGGTGADAFVFLRRAEGGDTITDFRSNDRIEIKASAFGGGLVAGDLDADLFVARPNNRALDAEDRFIFRTTDATLWFDANGSARGGRVLVADLQDGATLDAGDIMLI